MSATIACHRHPAVPAVAHHLVRGGHGPAVTCVDPLRSPRTAPVGLGAGAQLWAGVGELSICRICVICAVWLLSMLLASCFASGLAPDDCSILAMSTAP